MSKSVISDFVGRFDSELSSGTDLTTGRIVLSENDLVLAAGAEDRLTIPLASIFDISIGWVPEDLADFFNSTVTIAFERNGKRIAAAIEGSNHNIDRFGTVLFKTILNGTKTKVMDRARVGGRVTDAQFITSELFLTQSTVEFRQREDPFTVDMTLITDFGRFVRDIDGTERTVLAFRHVNDGTAVTTLTALPSPRKMELLSRYLQMEYSELIEELEAIELTTGKKEMLITMYSAGGIDESSLSSVLGMESADVTQLLQELQTDGLVTDSDDPTLTSKGKAVASRYLEDVNT
jgi:helix-turn-helix protein